MSCSGTSSGCALYVKNAGGGGNPGLWKSAAPTYLIASVDAVLKSDKKTVKAWAEEGMAKIVLKVKDEPELIKFFQQAKDNDLTASLITDAGRTVVAPGTKTCAGIGPDDEELIDKITGSLSLL